MRRRPRGCAKRARSSSPRPRCRTTACCRRGCRVSIPSPATPGTSARTRAAPRPAQAPRVRPVTARCISAPISAGPGGWRAAWNARARRRRRRGAGRLPACWNGRVALKPSLGRVPVDPFYVGRVAGPMTRNVDDAALMMSVLSRPDRRDGMSLPAVEINWKALDKSPRKLRIGLMLDLGVGQPLEKEVREVVVKAAKAFESAGAMVTEVDSILTREMLDGLDNFWRARSWDDLSKLSPEERAKTLPYIHDWAESAAKLSGVDVVRGFNATMAIRAAAAKLFCEVDYVISPVSPAVNFPAEFAAPRNDPLKPFEHIAYTVPWNMSENPAASLNGGYDKKGFPIGVQIVGRRFDDLGVLGMAKAFEGLRGPQKPWPAPPKK